MCYHITGITRDGKRFKIATRNIYIAMDINIWQGSVWEVAENGKRTLIKRVYN